jgi:hypothetical protein
MSKSAKKRSLPPPTPPRDKEGSGRFAIGVQPARPDTLLPPPGAQALRASVLEPLPLLEIDTDAVAVAPQRGPASGVFSNGPKPNHSENDRKNERAELVIEDLSLRLDNPYAVSSLVPPPKKPFPIAKALGVASALIALGAGGWFVARNLPSTSVDASAPIAATVQPAIAPVVVAPAVAVATRPGSTVTSVPDVIAPEQKTAPQPIAVGVAAVASAPRVTQAPRIGAPTQRTKPSATRGEAVAQTPAAEESTAQAALRDALQGAAKPQSTTETKTETPTSAPGAEATTPTAVTEHTEALGALPETPSRADVVAGFEAVHDAIATCAAGKHGVVQIDATIANSGRVSRSLIVGVFSGTTEGSCMARAARAARFPQFSQPSLNVNYPIAL